MEQRSVDVAIIGAGTAGMAAYRTAREHTRSLAMIDSGPLGTTCARVGCMPSKLLIAAAETAQAVREAHRFGVHCPPPRIDGRAVMSRVHSERDRFVGFVLEAVHALPADDLICGTARFLDDHRLQVDDRLVLTASRVVIATGSRASVPPWMAALGDRVLTNDTVLDRTDLPGSVAVFGAGAIGLELGQALAWLGVRVRLFGRGGAAGPLTDPHVVQAAAAAFAGEYPVNLDADVRRVAREGDEVVVEWSEAGAARTERFEYLLATTGRRPNTDRLGLADTMLPLGPRGVPEINRSTGQVGTSHVFIAGDAANDLPLLHEAATEGKIAGDNAGRFPDVRAHPRWASFSIVFTDPQMAMVGESHRALLTRNAAFAVGTVSFEDQGRARVIGKARGLLNLYGEIGSGRFLGAEMVGPAAEHIAHLLAWALQSGQSVQAMLDNPFYHPVIEEGVRTALRQLAHAMRMGPVPVERCLDCGPGT